MEVKDTEEEQFSEFENIHLPYRRSLLPWWIWGILSVYTLFGTLSLISEVWEYFNGNIFRFQLFGVSWFIQYPYYPVLSVCILVAVSLSAILLWLEKKKAAGIALSCFATLLAFCAVLLVAGLFTGHFYVRIEMLICMDMVMRLKDMRREWEFKAISHNSIEA